MDLESANKRYRRLFWNLWGNRKSKNQSLLKMTVKTNFQSSISKREIHQPTTHPLLPTGFSYTQLDTYIRCPLHYKYQYILKIPTPLTHSLAFGDTIHKSLYNFYTEFEKNNDIGVDALLEFYKKNWLPIGYSSAEHQKKRKESGEKILGEYLKRYHKKNLNIIGLEKPFKIKVASDIFIVGKIDRIDGLPEDKIEIIDYKTGKMPKESELKKSLQLSIYALAAIDRGLFNKKLSDVVLSFYYLESGEKISFQKTLEDLDETRDKIIKTVESIRRNEFPVTNGPGLAFCPYPLICEACH